jgi:Calpain large subunit, domain III
MQGDARLKNKSGKELTIGFSLVRVENNRKQRLHKWDPAKTEDSPTYINSREVTQLTRLDHGRYVLIPTTFGPGEVCVRLCSFSSFFFFFFFLLLLLLLLSSSSFFFFFFFFFCISLLFPPCDVWLTFIYCFFLSYLVSCDRSKVTISCVCSPKEEATASRSTRTNPEPICSAATTDLDCVWNSCLRWVYTKRASSTT